MDVNQKSATNRTVLFNLFEYWGQKADVKHYECILEYLCQHYDLSASWFTTSSHEKTKGKSPLNLIIEKNIVISFEVIELVRKKNPIIAEKIDNCLLYIIEKVAKRLKSSDGPLQQIEELTKKSGIFSSHTDIKTLKTQELLSPDRNLARFQSADMSLQQLKDSLTIKFPPKQKSLLHKLIGKIQKKLLPGHYFKGESASSLYQGEFDKSFDKYFKHLYRYIEQFSIHMAYLDCYNTVCDLITKHCPDGRLREKIISTLTSKLLRTNRILSNEINIAKGSHLVSFEKKWQQVCSKFKKKVQQKLQECLNSVLDVVNLEARIKTKKIAFIALCGHVYTPLMVESVFFRNQTETYLSQIKPMMIATQTGMKCYGKYNHEFACLLANVFHESTVMFEERPKPTEQKAEQEKAKPPVNLLSRVSNKIKVGIHCLFNFDAISIDGSSTDKSMLTMSPAPKQKLLKLISSLPRNAQLIISVSKYNLYIAVREVLSKVTCLTYEPRASINQPLHSRKIPNETRMFLLNKFNLSMNSGVDLDDKYLRRMNAMVDTHNEHYCNLITVVATKTTNCTLKKGQ